MSLWQFFMPSYLATRRTAQLSIASIVMMAVTTAALAQDRYTDIRRLGTSNAFSRPGPQNGDELKALFRQYRADYEKVLADANWDGNPDDLFRAVEAGSFSEARYPVGHTFEWMALRRNGVATASVPIRWAGSAPFDAFEIRVETNGKEYRLLIPKACGNLALVGVRDLPPKTITPPQLRVQAPNNCAGANVTVDVSIAGGMPAGGRLELKLTRPSGQTEDLTASSAGSGYRWQSELKEAGTYTFTGTTVTADGRSTTTTERLNLDQCLPTCNLTVTPPPMDPTPKAGSASVTIDMCQSSARVGSIASRTVRIYHTPLEGQEQILETLSLEADACSKPYVLPEYGQYRFEADVVDDRGMKSTCTGSYTLVKPERKLDPFFTIFLGDERRWRHDPNEGSAGFVRQEGTFEYDRSAALLGGTIGIAYPVADDKAQVFGQFGVAGNLRDGGASLYADFGVDKKFEKGFFGGGVGVYDFNHSDFVDGTIFIHGGMNITEKLQWYLEGRVFMSMLDMIDNNYVYQGGIRYFFGR